MSRTLVVVPARLASTRLPAKILADLGGVPVVEWVRRAAVKASIGPVVVAADDRRTIRTIESYRGAAVMTPYLWRIAWLLFGVTSILAVAAAVAPEFWLDLFFGAEYAAHGHILRWWAAIFLVENTMLPLEAGLRAMEKTRPALTAELWRLLLALLILYPLVVVLGESGAMLGLLLLASAKILVLAIALKRRLAMA